MKPLDDVKSTIKSANTRSWRYSMTNLKLHRDETESQSPAPAPIPFDQAAGSWRQTEDLADLSHTPEGEQGEEAMDSIKRVEEALNRVENTFESLSEQVEEYCEPIRLADWLNNEDDGPWAA